MTLLRTLTPLAPRATTPGDDQIARLQSGLHPLTRSDGFEVSHAQSSSAANGMTVGDNGHAILRADTRAVERAATTSAVLDGVQQTLSGVHQSMAQSLAKANATVQTDGVMSYDSARDIALGIYRDAFPGLTLTEHDVSRAIEMLRTGAISQADLQTQVAEGARLVNDQDPAANETKKQGHDGGGKKQGHEEGGPNHRSILAQQDRLQRLSSLMEAGILPEGKLNITGNFGYDSNKAPLGGQYLSGGKFDHDHSKGKHTHAKDRAAADGTSHVDAGASKKNGRHDRNAQLSISGATASSLSEASSELSQALSDTHSPIMLDLNHDGHLGVTGASTAKDRIDGTIGRTVSFDIDGDGKKENVEWMAGDGDGMLVDDRDGGVTAASRGNGQIDGSRLFGDQGGKYANGYEKLQQLDANHDGKLTGHELDGLKAWIDDGDGVVEEGELKTLVDLGVTELDVRMQLTTNDRGEMLMRSTFTQNGEKQVSEDVWFSEDGGAEGQLTQQGAALRAADNMPASADFASTDPRTLRNAMARIGGLRDQVATWQREAAARLQQELDAAHLRSRMEPFRA